LKQWLIVAVMMEQRGIDFIINLNKNRISITALI
jgi:hypothetical protein